MASKYTLHPVRAMWLFILELLAMTMLLSACGNAQSKVYHVGILSGLDFFAPTTDGFKAKMTELGYIEGKNIVYDLQKTNIDVPAYQTILKKFVADKVDLIFVFPTEAAQEAKTVTQGTNIPVLFAQAILEGANLVNSVREPGGNITGVRFNSPELAARQFEILHQIVPQAKHIWIPYLKGYPSVPAELEAVRSDPGAIGITFLEAPATSPDALRADLEKHDQVHDIDAMLTIPEPFAATPDAFVVFAKYAAEHNIPIGGSLITAEGYASLFGIAPDPLEVGKLAAPMADKILKGTPAGSIPVSSPDGHLQINLKSAEKLGIKIPNGISAQATTILR